MLVRDYVDFGHVEEQHLAIDARLANWARWSHNREHRGASPMFLLYRATEANQTRGLVLETLNPLDAIDAQRVQNGVSALPTPHRLALSWSYIKRSNPRALAQELGHSLAGLARLVRDARQMLVNRGV